MTTGLRLAFAVLCSAGVAAAQAPRAATPDLLPRDVETRFKVADLDGSGGLSRDEAERGGYDVSNRFTAVDRDGDRIITLEEITTYLAGQARDWASADRDGDGTLTREEASASPTLASIFANADRDNDGVLRKEEHAAWSQTTLYQNVDLPYVVPNIINKKF